MYGLLKLGLVFFLFIMSLNLVYAYFIAIPDFLFPLATINKTLTLSTASKLIGKYEIERDILAVSIAMIFAGLGFYFLKNNRILKLVKFKSQKKTQVQKLDLIFNENNHFMILGMLERQNQAIQHLNMKLHDDLGSMLSTVKLHCSALADINQTFSSEHWIKHGILLDQACDEVRKISQDLTLGNINSLMLIDSLKQLCESINSNSDIKINFFSHGMNLNLTNIEEAHIYYLINRLLSNMIKEYESTEITLQLNYFKNNLNIIIEDNGKGFNENSVFLAPKEGQQILAQVKRLGGTLNLDSTVGKGTTVIIEIPINPNIQLN